MELEKDMYLILESVKDVVLIWVGKKDTIGFVQSRVLPHSTIEELEDMDQHLCYVRTVEMRLETKGFVL